MRSKSVPVTGPLDFGRALADETRQRIMKFCCCEWRSVGDIAAELGVTQPTVSHHLALLRRARLVQVRPEGRQTYYTLDQEQVAVCCGRLMRRYAPDLVASEVQGKGRR